MIINGKHVVYEWTPMGDIISSMVRSMHKRLIKSAIKANSLVAWLNAQDERQLRQYYEGTINADLVHDWLPEERIYRG